MIKFMKGLGSDPVRTLADWQDSRWPWGIIAFAMVAMVLLAHYVFQDWMHMLPCEQCVYIRYGNLVMALGCVIAMIDPKAVWAKLVGFVITIYGLVYTIICSVKLIGIHDAVHSDDPEAMFGMQGCSTEPHFPFGLPLEKWAPDWFQPTGDCGYDAPVVPDGVELGALQRWFIELYQSYDGWYLIPQWKFMDMASCCLLACIVAAAFIAAMLFGWGARLTKKASSNPTPGVKRAVGDSRRPVSSCGVFVPFRRAAFRSAFRPARAARAGFLRRGASEHRDEPHQGRIARGVLVPDHAPLVATRQPGRQRQDLDRQVPGEHAGVLLEDLRRGVRLKHDPGRGEKVGHRDAGALALVRHATSPRSRSPRSRSSIPPSATVSISSIPAPVRPRAPK